MIKASGVGRDGGNGYPQTIVVRGRVARKETQQEAQRKGLFWTGRTYFFQDDKSYVSPELVEEVINPETDPVELDRRRVFADMDEINTSL